VAAVDNHIHIDLVAGNHTDLVQDLVVVDIVPQVQKLILDYLWTVVVVYQSLVHFLLNQLINIISNKGIVRYRYKTGFIL